MLNRWPRRAWCKLLVTDSALILFPPLNFPPEMIGVVAWFSLGWISKLYFLIFCSSLVIKRIACLATGYTMQTNFDFKVFFFFSCVAYSIAFHVQKWQMYCFLLHVKVFFANNISCYFQTWTLKNRIKNYNSS